MTEQQLVVRHIVRHIVLVAITPYSQALLICTGFCACVCVLLVNVLVLVSLISFVLVVSRSGGPKKFRSFFY